MAKSRVIGQGHPWIFKDPTESTPTDSSGSQIPSGSLVDLYNPAGNLLGCGLFDSESPLSIRILSTEKGENFQDPQVRERIDQAINRRLPLQEKTNAYRLINGEGDLLPGLICDIYQGVAVFKLDGKGPSEFYHLEGIARYLKKRCHLRGAFLKERGGEKNPNQKFLFGQEALNPVLIQENQVLFEVDFINGQKTGFFLDQRDNRAFIAPYSRNKSVLNLFSYTGGFSLYCGFHNPFKVTSVDSSELAIKNLQRNWELNQLPKDIHRGVAADVFDFLKHSLIKKEKFDLIIVDPPSFAPNQKSRQAALKAYKNLALSALKLLNPLGFLAFSSCSSHISESELESLLLEECRKNQRRPLYLYRGGQGSDHPFQGLHPEGRYLKFFFFQLL